MRKEMQGDPKRPKRIEADYRRLRSERTKKDLKKPAAHARACVLMSHILVIVREVCGMMMIRATRNMMDT